MSFVVLLPKPAACGRLPSGLLQHVSMVIMAIGMFGVAAPAAAATAPAVEAPETKLYEGDVPVRVSMPGGAPGEYFLDIAFYTQDGWSEPHVEQASPDASGMLDAALPAGWLDEQGPGAVRWRLRACLDDRRTQRSDWRMFGRSIGARSASASAATPAPTSEDRGPTASGSRSATPADPDAAVIASPTPGAYSQDVPLVIQSPPSGVVTAIVMQLEYYDQASGAWVTAHDEQVETDEHGAVVSTLSLEALAGLQPGAVRWRVRARAAERDDAWSSWVVFGLQFAQ